MEKATFRKFVWFCLVAMPSVAVTMPAAAEGGRYETKIRAVAKGYRCAQNVWQGRGKAPIGYVQGMALSFGRSLCRLRTNDPSYASVIARADSKNASKDAVTWYRDRLEDNGLDVDSAGPDALRAVYLLGMGLGMRESSGKHCVGWDASAANAANRPSNEQEAGLFQTSYNSIGATGSLRDLYDEYRADPSRCWLGVFKEGVSCRQQSIAGAGAAGREFQEFAKSCPAFAAEYAMTLLRVLRKHFGPINRKEAEVRSDCDTMLRKVQSVIEDDPNNACLDLE